MCAPSPFASSPCIPRSLALARSGTAPRSGTSPPRGRWAPSHLVSGAIIVGNRPGGFRSRRRRPIRPARRTPRCSTDACLHGFVVLRLRPGCVRIGRRDGLLRGGRVPGAVQGDAVRDGEHTRLVSRARCTGASSQTAGVSEPAPGRSRRTPRQPDGRCRRASSKSDRVEPCAVALKGTTEAAEITDPEPTGAQNP